MFPTALRTDAAEWLRFCLVPGLPGTAQRALLKAFGSPEGAIAAGSQAVAAIAGRSVADALAAGPPDALFQATLRWLEAPGCRLLALGDVDYPRALLQIPDPPTIIFAMGDVRFLNRPSVAVVGSRNATRQGLIDAHAFACALSDAGYGIVSGLALGIDAAAHRGGLAGASSSIAVVGTGLDRVYPARNRDLAHELANRGAVISEFALGIAPAAPNFPRRNRIISGLARGVVVIEAALRSGSLTTARLALEQGRDVFAMPGSIHSPLSKGCHWLIKQGAKLVESSEDVLAELEGRPAREKGADQGLAQDEGGDPVLLELGHSPASLDALALRTGMAAAALANHLTRLELDGAIERLPGGLFRRIVHSS